jgi:SAM-dependent methyltransferase
VSQTAESDTIYTDPAYRQIDVGSMMRTGHPDVAEGDQVIVDIVAALRAEAGRPLRIIDVGSGSGDLSLLLTEHLDDCEIVANDVAPMPVAQAIDKLAPHHRASVFSEPFETWTEPVDVVISWGSHHHLDHGYLNHVAEVLRPDGRFIVGDEFCPEYLTPEDQERLARADEISVVDGYVFDDPEQLARYRRTGELPGNVRRMEQARRRALWDWYKFVGDYAVERDAWDVLIAELAIARDDFVTSFDGEHKTSPRLLERELSLRGFQVVDRKLIGERPAALRSFVVYACRPPRNVSS